jgi:adenine phosphoribosyltransferase
MTTLPIAPPSMTTQIPLDFIRQAIRDIPDYPKPGILFKDITTVLRDATLFRALLDHLQERCVAWKPDYILGIEARGFIFGAPLADRLGAGFVPVRKKGKLPGKTVSYSYDLEYGSDTIEIHEGAIEPGKRVIVIDDLLATGGTAGACVKLAQDIGADVVGLAFLIELDFLKGREKFDPTLPIESLIHF